MDEGMATGAQGYQLTYRIIDAKRRNPTRTVAVEATPADVEHLVQRGYLQLSGILKKDESEAMTHALERILLAEKDSGETKTDTCFGARYVRHLLDKDPSFLPLFNLTVTKSIAQAVLGPQITFDEVVARVVDLEDSPPEAPWHIHHRVIPTPTPPFFCYPHAINCLLYLDGADDSTGQLCVLPGSHRRFDVSYSYHDTSPKADELPLTLQPGDCVLIHVNLWHRVLPATAVEGQRRLLIFGYLPAWLKGEEESSSKPNNDRLHALRQHPNRDVREFSGHFVWG